MYIDRSGAEALMPEDYQREIVESVPAYSTVMTYGYRAADMTRAQRRIPCLANLPTAYFSNPGPSSVDDDEKFKRTSKVSWEDKYIDAEELNVIIPIPEAVLNDADYDIWGQIKPKILESFGVAFDSAVFYGTRAPQIWPDPIVTSCQAAGNYVTLGSLGDIYDDIMGVNGVIAKVEEDGFMVNGHVCAMTMRSRLRGLRDNDGNPVFKALAKEGVQGKTNYMLDGEQCIFPKNGVMDNTQTNLISGDWTQLMYAIRQDLTYKILTEATIQDPDTGAIVYNLAQQNFVALRACMRLGWQVPNPINRLNQDEDTRYPFAVLVPQGS
jgi:HK97 family phage major capsid protein